MTTVGFITPVGIMPLYNTLKAPSFTNSGHINQRGVLENSNRNLVTGTEFFGMGEFTQHAKSRSSGFLKMSGQRLIYPMRLLLQIAELSHFSSRAFLRSDLGYCTGPGFDNRYRNCFLGFLIKNLGHSNLAAKNTPPVKLDRLKRFCLLCSSNGLLAGFGNGSLIGLCCLLLIVSHFTSPVKASPPAGTSLRHT